MENSLVGGVPGGKPLISPATRPARITFYVALPPPGRHHNVVRYPIAVVGPGYRGLLVSSSTRLAGLVSVADVAPSLRALDRGERPKIRARPSNHPLAQLARLDQRLNDAHDARIPAMSVLAALMASFGLLALFTRSPLIGRAAFLVAPASAAIAVLLSAAAVTTPWVAVLLLALTVVVAALGAAALLRPRVPLALGLGALFAFLFAVMWARPEWNTLAVIGPHPDGGGRFYGLTNQVETLLLSPALVLGALAGLRALPVVALVVAAGVAASRIGADGGGLVVYLAGFLVLGLRVGRVPALRAAAATAVGRGSRASARCDRCGHGRLEPRHRRGRRRSRLARRRSRPPDPSVGCIRRLDLEQRPSLRRERCRAGLAGPPPAAPAGARRAPGGAGRLARRERHADRRRRLGRALRTRPLGLGEKRRGRLRA